MNIESLEEQVKKYKKKKSKEKEKHRMTKTLLEETEEILELT